MPRSVLRKEVSNIGAPERRRLFFLVSFVFWFLLVNTLLNLTYPQPTYFTWPYWVNWVPLREGEDGDGSPGGQGQESFNTDEEEDSTIPNTHSFQTFSTSTKSTRHSVSEAYQPQRTPPFTALLLFGSPQVPIPVPDHPPTTTHPTTRAGFNSTGTAYKFDLLLRTARGFFPPPATQQGSHALDSS